MKKLLLALAFLLLGTVAHASNCPTYPYTLTNGQIADANQVMANFSSILNCANGTLTTGGANSGITSLSGLTTPLSVPQGGTNAATLAAHGTLIGEGTTAVVATSPGTSGQVLTSNGASSDPTYQAIPAGGTVTSVATGTGLTGGPITATGTISLATIIANTDLMNATSGTAAPTAVAVPSCSATGDAILYTSGTGWGCATGYAPLASPGLTGTPTAPTASGGTNTTQIATTAFVATSFAPLASPAFTGSTPTSNGTALVLTTDGRFGGVTQNSKSAAYGLALSDAGGQIYHPSADTTARTWTIPANSSVAFPIGTKIDLVNDCSAGIVTVAITTDTLVWFTSGSTGSRALAACGEATLSKVTSTRWVITGVGLS